MGGRARDGLRGSMGKPVRVADDKLFKSITSIKICGTELLKRTNGKARHASSPVVGLGDGKAQLDARTEELA